MDQTVGVEVVVESSARRILDTHFDRKDESSAANERDFVAVITTNSFSPFCSTLMTFWLPLSFPFFFSFSLSGLSFPLFDLSFPDVIVHSPLMASTFPPFLIFTQSNRLLVRISSRVLGFFLVAIESSLLGRRFKEEVETRDWNCISSPGSRIEDQLGPTRPFS